MIHLPSPTNTPKVRCTFGELYVNNCCSASEQVGEGREGLDWVRTKVRGKEGVGRGKTKGRRGRELVGIKLRRGGGGKLG